MSTLQPSHEPSPSATTAAPPTRLRTYGGLAVAGLFLAANILLPVCYGDFYPFTSAPMFRDAPQLYCNYKVVDDEQQMIDPHMALCQRIYDGNPVGYGVGLKPPPVIENFGCVRTKEELAEHLKLLLQRAEHQSRNSLTIFQEVIGPHDDLSVGVIRIDEVTVVRDNGEKSPTNVPTLSQESQP